MKAFYWISLASVLMLAGCSAPQTQSCGPRQLGTRVSVTSIGTASRKFEVTASGFTPNSQARLSIDNFPKRGEIRETVTIGASGSLFWTIDAPLMLATDPDFEPDSEVRTTLAEVQSQCFGLTMMKERAFGRIV